MLSHNYDLSQLILWNTYYELLYVPSCPVHCSIQYHNIWDVWAGLALFVLFNYFCLIGILLCLLSALPFSTARSLCFILGHLNIVFMIVIIIKQYLTPQKIESSEGTTKKYFDKTEIKIKLRGHRDIFRRLVDRQTERKQVIKRNNWQRDNNKLSNWKKRTAF